MAEFTSLIEKMRATFASHLTRDHAFRDNALLQLRNALVQEEASLLEALRLDLGKVPHEAYASEIATVLSEIDYARKRFKKWLRPKHVKGTRLAWPSSGTIYAEPRGVTLIIGPWNYPVQLTMLPLVGAIAAGCCAMVKPSEITSHTAAAIVRLIAKTFEPGHVVAATGGAETAQELLTHPRDLVFFTGSAKTGKLIAQAAAETLSPTVLELGGKNPCIVDQTARLNVAAKRIVWGRMMNAGQTCVAPDQVFVHASVREAFIEHAMNACADWAKLLMEDGGLNRIITAAHVERLNRLAADGNCLCGGSGEASARTFPPTLLVDAPSTAAIHQEEIFGPLLHVESYDDLSALVNLLNTKPTPLAGYLFSNDRSNRELFTKHLRAGSICINDVTVQLFAKLLPFGGMGASGMGRYHGEASFRTFSVEKSCLLCSTRLDLPWRYPPTRIPLKQFRRVLKFLLKH